MKKEVEVRSFISKEKYFKFLWFVALFAGILIGLVKCVKLMFI